MYCEPDGDCRSIQALHDTSRAWREADLAGGSGECVNGRRAEDAGDARRRLGQTE